MHMHAAIIRLSFGRKQIAITASCAINFLSQLTELHIRNKHINEQKWSTHHPAYKQEGLPVHLYPIPGLRSIERLRIEWVVQFEVNQQNRLRQIDHKLPHFLVSMGKNAKVKDINVHVHHSRP